MENDDGFFADFVIFTLVAAVGYGAWRLWRRLNRPVNVLPQRPAQAGEDVEASVAEFNEELNMLERFLKIVDAPWSKKNFGRASE